MQTIGTKKFVVLGMLAVLLAGVLSFFASAYPDGLERAAIDAGFMHKETVRWTLALFPNYRLPACSDNELATGAIGVAGVLIVFLVLWGLGKWLARDSRS